MTLNLKQPKQKSFKQKSLPSSSPVLSSIERAADASLRAQFKPWIIWGCAGLFYLYEMVLRASPGIMANDLMRDFEVTSTALGVLGSFYYYAYVALQIPCGVIVDRLGTRIVITASTLLCVIGTFLFALSEALPLAQLGRFLVGAGSACAFLSCLKIGAQWFSPARFALIAGLTNMMGTLGGMMSGPPFAILMNSFGWRQATSIAACIGIALALVCWVFISEKPEESITEAQSKKGNLSLLTGLINVAKIPQNWIIAIIGGLLYVPISAFCELWAIPFLMEKYTISNEQASLASIMVYMGVAVGSPFTAKLSDLWKSRTRVIALSAILSSLFFLMTLYMPSLPFVGMLVILFFAGVMNSGQVLCFTAIKETMPNALSGTAIGFTNALVMMSGVIFQPILGLLLDLGWTGQFNEDGTRLYDAAAYHGAILAIPACLILSWLLILLVKDTYPKIRQV